VAAGLRGRPAGGAGLDPGQPLTAIATYRTEIYAGTNVFGYLLIWMSFPVIGLIAGATVASVFADSAPPEPSPGRDSWSTYVDGRTLPI